MPLTSAQIEAHVDGLSLPQKVRLLTGEGFWSLPAEPTVGLRSVVVSDGPSGVRGATWDERDPSLNLPSATALAATWDPELAYRYGVAAAHEARRKGVDVVLGPTVNLQRSPLAGRHFEAYSEDPLLTADLADAFVRGIQDHGVSACPKHYVANDFETDRFTASVEVGERALRELYLAPFERTVLAGTWMVMSAYNAVNGTTMSESPLLSEPLKGEWGFDGVVVSDWMAVRSLASAAAAQDLAMPGPVSAWGPLLVAAVEDGQVPVEVVDDKVRRILRLAARVGALREASGAAARATGPVRPERRPSDPADIAFAREVESRAIVLVRNDGILPLLGSQPPERGPARVAVLGQSAARPRTQGGGSATVVPVATISPLDGIREAFPDTEVTFATGALVHDGVLPFDLEDIRDPETGDPGLRVRFLDADGAVVLTEVRRATDLVWLGDAPPAHTFEAVTDLTPARSGPVELGWSSAGTTTLDVDGTTVLSRTLDVEGLDFAAAVLTPPSTAVRLDLEGHRSYRLRWTHPLTALPGAADGLATTGVLGFTAGWRPAVDSAEALIAEAVEVARGADVAVVVVGTNAQAESEGLDRTDLRLPGRQDDLVAAVAAVNPRTVVVVNAGSPVEMPWREDAAAVLLTWFGGQEYGHALADVLTGAVEPGGRLPTTWPAVMADVPVLDVTPRDGVLAYPEGIHIGYRAWLRAGTEPAYPFGFGLGYTTWRYDAVRVLAADADADGGGDVRVAVDVTNTGDRAGREVVQVYLARPGSAVDRPVCWLVGSAVVTADAGRPVTAQVRVRARGFEHWDEQAGRWAREPGTFTLRAAPDVTASGVTTTLTR